MGGGQMVRVRVIIRGPKLPHNIHSHPLLLPYTSAQSMEGVELLSIASPAFVM